MVDYLLSIGTPTCELDDSGNTALHYAANAGSVTIVHSLLRAGANINILNKLQQNALHIVSQNSGDNFFEVSALVCTVILAFILNCQF